MEPRPLLVELSFRAKTYDIDYAGIVHNSVYIRWLEDLRLKLLEENFSLPDLLSNRQSPILEKTEIRYRWPLRLFEEAIGQMWISHLGKARWEVQAEFVRGETVIASATQTGYFMDMEKYQPIRIPESMREKWEAAQL